MEPRPSAHIYVHNSNEVLNFRSENGGYKMFSNRQSPTGHPGKERSEEEKNRRREAEVARFAHLKKWPKATPYLLLFLSLHYLEEAFMLFTIPIYSKSEKIRNRNYRKIYAIDWALADAIAPAEGVEITKKFENMVGFLLPDKREIGARPICILIPVRDNFFQCGTTLSRCGTTFSGAGQPYLSAGQLFPVRDNLISVRDNFFRCGTTLSRCGTTFSSAGQPYPDAGQLFPVRDNLIPMRDNFFQCGTTLSRCGTTFSGLRAPFPFLLFHFSFLLFNSPISISGRKRKEKLQDHGCRTAVSNPGGLFAGRNISNRYKWTIIRLSRKYP